MQVGVRELKQRLSEIIDLAASGEDVIITDRGTPRVRLSALAPTGVLEQGIAEGWIRPPLRDGPIGQGPRVRADTRTSDALDEDRGD
jgi:prevent-host-death family protein